MKKLFLSFVLVLFGFMASFCSGATEMLEDLPGESEYFVTNMTELETVLNFLDPGDVVILKNGVWNNANVLFSGTGTDTKPITFKAQTTGGVVFSGDSKMRIAGQHLIASGFAFDNGTVTSGSVIEFRNGNQHARYSRLTNVSIKNYSPTDKNIDTKWVSIYGYRNRVDHCSFEGKTNSGTTLIVWMNDQPDYHLIDHNYFGPRPDLGFNGGETIRIGTSDWSLYSSYTTVENNLFEECDGEIEIISNKSCHNVYRYNTFLNCNGALTLRHGDDCEVYNNFFIDAKGKSGSGGVRVIGRRHKVFNNYFEGLNGDGFRAAISLTNGQPDSPLNGYYQVEDAQIGFNTVVNCRQPIAIGSGISSTLTLPPVRVLMANNLVKNRVNRTMIVMHDSGADVSWQGNLVDGASGIAPNAGIKMVSLDFTSDGYIMRPGEGPLNSNPATSAMPGVTNDIDLQDRPAGSRHVGCDQVSDAPALNRPKRREDVGVIYETNTAYFNIQKTEDIFFSYFSTSHFKVRFEEVAVRTVSLFSLDGKVVDHFEGTASSYRFNSVKHPGIYLLRVVRDNITHTYKVAF